MLSALEELPHLLLLYHFTYHSLDLKMTLIDKTVLYSGVTLGIRHTGRTVLLWYKNAFHNDTLFLTSLNLSV